MKDFNQKLDAWHDVCGCTAEFSWTYNHKGQKQLAVAAIDLAVYRRRPPDAETLESMLEKAEKG